MQRNIILKSNTHHICPNCRIMLPANYAVRNLNLYYYIHTIWQNFTKFMMRICPLLSQYCRIFMFEILMPLPYIWFMYVLYFAMFLKNLIIENNSTWFYVEFHGIVYIFIYLREILNKSTPNINFLPVFKAIMAGSPQHFFTFRNHFSRFFFKFCQKFPICVC